MIGPILCTHLKYTDNYQYAKRKISQMETYDCASPRRPSNIEDVSRVGISHQGSWLRARTTSEIRVFGTFDRAVGGDLSNDTGNWIFHVRRVAIVRFTIYKHLTDVSVSRNESCCEKWDK